MTPATGTLKASHVRTKRAALVDAPMSSTPASTAGWLATTPIERPPSRAKPTTMLAAKSGWISKELRHRPPAPWTTSRMSYGCWALSGMMLFNLPGAASSPPA